ncbi:ABC transporter permease [Jeotgalibacillus salarius]|uniref:ABC transporter permease n=1 Tax=Jeotgalibacillus salarius TaxID=546023 RepID=A0A4Y8LFD9_9BACL|nr:ABC transporter permease [Jeotgalibacillus salarius]TFE01548.1 ABC transporter permease [Jeotgalibacillus salarius]
MRMLAVAERIIQQIFKDRRTLALMLVAPLLILTLVYFLFQTDQESIARIGETGLTDPMGDQLEEADVDLVSVEPNESLKELLLNEDLDAYFLLEDDLLQVTYNASSTTTIGSVKAQIAGLRQQHFALQVEEVMMKAAESGLIQPDEAPGFLNIEETYEFGSDETTFFDTISPFLIGFFVFFFVFLISGISLLRERTTGTLDRLLATPVKRSDIVFGYLIGYGIFAVIQTIIVVFYSTYILDIQIAGSIWYVLLINSLIAFVALAFGLLLSTFANSELQMVQFIPIVVIPQIFFAGLLPVDSLQEWLQVIAKIMPLYYGGDALKAVMIFGRGIDDILLDLFILFGIAIVFTFINIQALKKYRKI